MTAPDPSDQDDPYWHAFCAAQDGEMWFDHGVRCRRPDFHKPPPSED